MADGIHKTVFILFVNAAFLHPEYRCKGRIAGRIYAGVGIARDAHGREASVRARIIASIGVTAASLSACLYIPKGPSGIVTHSMGGPPAIRNGSIAASRPAMQQGSRSE